MRDFSVTTVGFQLYPSFWSGGLWMTPVGGVLGFWEYWTFRRFLTGELHEVVSNLGLTMGLVFRVEFSYLFNA